MPVVTPRPTGMVHNVADAVRFLKNFAWQYKQVAAVNQLENLQAPSSRLFPRPSFSRDASSARTNAQVDLTARLAGLESIGGHRFMWTISAPPSMLLLPLGKSVGAIADLMDLQVHEQQGKAVVAMTLDVVHEPKLLSEFEQHEKQTLDRKAHYHFYPPQGVALSAAKLLEELQGNGVIEGASMFLKAALKTDIPCTGKSAGDACTPLPVQGLPTGPCGQYVCEDINPLQVTELTCTKVNFTMAGTVCRAANGACQPARVCTGDDVRCLNTVAPNGMKCPYTSEDHNPTFWPFAKADSSEPKASAAHAEPQHGWPECWGKCVAGMCTLQHKEPGCCVLNKHSDHYENYYGGPYDAKADDDYHRGYDDDNLVCWDK